MATLIGEPVSPLLYDVTDPENGFRVVLKGRVIQISDISADPEYALTEATTLGRARTQLGVPLMREGSPIGVIILSRTRVEPFTPKQIDCIAR